MPQAYGTVIVQTTPVTRSVVKMNPVTKYRIVEDLEDDLTCRIGICNYVAANVFKLYSHYRVMHVNDKQFSSGCLYSKQCFHQSKFQSFWGLNSHLRKYHSIFFDASFREKKNDGTEIGSPVACADSLDVEIQSAQQGPITGKFFLRLMLGISYTIS